MRVYISGGITGVKNYEKNFERGVYHWFDKGIHYQDIRNPVWFTSHIKGTWEQYMKVCIKELCDCDAIYMLKNWEHSRGAKEEYRIAEMLGLEIHYEKGE